MICRFESIQRAFDYAKYSLKRVSVRAAEIIYIVLLVHCPEIGKMSYLFVSPKIGEIRIEGLASKRRRMPVGVGYGNDSFYQYWPHFAAAKPPVYITALGPFQPPCDCKRLAEAFASRMTNLPPAAAFCDLIA